MFLEELLLGGLAVGCQTAPHLRVGPSEDDLFPMEQLGQHVRQGFTWDPGTWESSIFLLLYPPAPPVLWSLCNREEGTGEECVGVFMGQAWK
jgi:hypothetical protein